MPTKEIAPGVLAVTGLPKDSDPSIFISYNGKPTIGYWLDDDARYISIPPGQWSIVGWSDELTGGQIYELGLTVREFKESLRSQGITNRALILKSENNG